MLDEDDCLPQLVPRRRRRLRGASFRGRVLSPFWRGRSLRWLSHD
jgi:hypothetical protein